MALLKLSSPWMLRSSLFPSRGSFTGFGKKTQAAIVTLRIQDMRKTTSDVTRAKDVEKSDGLRGAGVYSLLARAPLNFKLDLKFISVLPSRFSGVLLMKRLIFTNSSY